MMKDNELKEDISRLIWMLIIVIPFFGIYIIIEILRLSIQFLGGNPLVVKLCVVGLAIIYLYACYVAIREYNDKEEVGDKMEDIERFEKIEAIERRRTPRTEEVEYDFGNIAKLINILTELKLSENAYNQAREKFGIPLMIMGLVLLPILIVSTVLIALVIIALLGTATDLLILFITVGGSIAFGIWKYAEIKLWKRRSREDLRGYVKRNLRREFMEGRK